MYFNPYWIQYTLFNVFSCIIPHIGCISTHIKYILTMLDVLYPFFGCILTYVECIISHVAARSTLGGGGDGDEDSDEEEANAAAEGESRKRKKPTKAARNGFSLDVYTLC
jgi:hypothetical protein